MGEGGVWGKEVSDRIVYKTAQSHYVYKLFGVEIPHPNIPVVYLSAVLVSWSTNHGYIKLIKKHDKVM